MVLVRTRQKLLYEVKGAIFDLGHFQRMLDRREKERLEAAMGFRGQFDEHRRFQFELLKRQGLQPHHRLLEIGCGPLTGGLPIIGYLEPGHYVGIDVRSSVLDLAWQQIGRAQLSGKNPRLVCSREFGARELAGQQRFDFILSFSVLYHLSDELLPCYFRAVRQRLGASGRCLVNVNTRDESSTWLEFPFLKRSLEDYQRLARAEGLATERLGELQQLGFRFNGIERRNEMLRLCVADP